MRRRKPTFIQDDHYNLLKVLKQTVEWLLCSTSSSNIWNTYGSLSRFSAIIDEILSHGLRSVNSEKYWPFVKEFYNVEIGDCDSHIGEHNAGETVHPESPHCRVWLEKCLLDHNLSSKLQMLIEDVHRLHQHYEETAFLRNPSCASALLICLKAVEQNQPMLLTDLDPSLIAPPLDLVQGTQRERTNAGGWTNKLVASSFSGRSNPDIATSHSMKRTQPEHSTDSDNFVRNHVKAGNVSCTELLYASPALSRRNRRFKRGSERSNTNGQNTGSYSKHDELLSIIFSESNSNDDNDSSAARPCDFHVAKSDVSSQQMRSLPAEEHQAELAGKPFSSVMQRSASCPGAFQCLNVVTGKYTNGIPDAQRLTVRNSAKEKHSYSVCGPGMQGKVNCDNTSGLLSTAVELHAEGESSKKESLESSLEYVDASSGWKAQHSRSRSDGISSVDLKVSSDKDELTVDPSLCLSLPVVFPEQDPQKKKSIFEGGGVTVPTECFFPRPEPGQTLTSFLSTDFNIHAELDKENAHFCISEALISAIEQIKCAKSLKLVEEEVESDEEIKKLTQRIRIRRREKLQERAVKNYALLSDGKTDTTTSHSASPMSTSHSSEFGTAESIGSDEESVEDLELSEHTKSNLSSVKESGLSLSMASMYSNADLRKANTYAHPAVAPALPEDKRMGSDSSSIHLSAEAVALSLLKRFSEKQLPRASDLEWLVSEQDAPQRLLPLPDSWPVSPDDDDDYDLKKTRLRGNLEWAPPRRQIIFIIHPEPKRVDALLKQNYRCAGCGMKIERSYAKKFRYCDYLGKFFCQCCHANDLTYIPARILWKWDFRKYCVSKFAYNLLDQMHCDPLFNVKDINSNLYRKVRQLDLCCEYRLQMFYLRDFIKTCRNTEQIKKELESLPEHILYEPHLYSISDLLQVKNGELARSLNNLVARCIGHVMKCILCQGKGFICEMCNNEKDIIFPFQLTKVCHCNVCGSCYHKKCFKTELCPKCIRIRERKKKLEETLYSDEEL